MAGPVTPGLSDRAVPAGGEILRRAAATERAAIAPVIGLRPALGVALPLLIGVASGHGVAGVTAAAGALPVGVASLTGRFRPPVLMWWSPRWPPGCQPTSAR